MPETTDWTRPFLETLRWCQPRLNLADPSTCFRSPELTPRGHLITDCNSNAEVAEIVNEVAARRSNLLRLESQLVDGALGLFPGDRVFAFRPHDSLFHGTSPPESDGFIDEWEIAPWDTWVGSWGGYVVTWVAQPFVGLVDAAIAANAEDCIRWVNDWRDPQLNHYCLPFMHRI
jgi:hypothetical protein